MSLSAVSDSRLKGGWRAASQAGSQSGRQPGRHILLTFPAALACFAASHSFVALASNSTRLDVGNEMNTDGYENGHVH